MRDRPTNLGPAGNEGFNDITSAPVLVSLIIGAVLLLLLVICRAYILFRRRKTRPANANGTEAAANQALSGNGPVTYSDAPPSYENLQSNRGLSAELEVPGVYLNEAMTDDGPPPPKYYDIVKETPPLTTISDSSK